MSLGLSKLWKGYLLVFVTLLSMVLLYFSYYSLGVGGPDHVVISNRLNRFIGFFLIGGEGGSVVTEVKGLPWYQFQEDEAILWFAAIGLLLAVVSLLWTLKLRKVYHLRPYCAFAASFSIICLVFGTVHYFRL